MLLEALSLDSGLEMELELILEIITLSDCKTGWFY
jgi:hypothetical protein